MSSQRMVYILLVCLLLVGVSGGLVVMRNAGVPDEAILCATDVQECPDGSFVHRLPPSCAFEACIPSSPDASAKTDGVLVGTVTLSPTCPVERTPPEPGCAPRPYQTTIEISSLTAAAPFSKTVETDADGVFTVTLPLGAYTLRAQSRTPLPRCEETTVALLAGVSTTTVTLSCDSGIR